MAKSLWRKTGKSKRELGITTPKAPRRKSCGCEFRGQTLFRRHYSCEQAHTWTETVKTDMPLHI